MCGRFAVTLPSDAMAQLFEAQAANALPEVPNYNVCPTRPVHVIRNSEVGRRLVAMRWGFLPSWYAAESSGPLLINARAETLAEKPAFREACRSRRCLIPATGFYEWTKDENGKRLPWYIHRADTAPIAFAAIWQDWQGQDRAETLPTCAIVTTAANDTMGRIHHRMPLILEPEQWPLWLGEAGKGAARLMQPGPEERLRFHRVEVAVNSNRASGPELIEEIDPEAGDKADSAAAGRLI